MGPPYITARRLGPAGPACALVLTRAYRRYIEVLSVRATSYFITYRILRAP